jgi:RNA polymerase sigma factor (TIGR02999 family)
MSRGPAVESCASFLALAAETMRSVLVDHARARNAIKRGGNRVRVNLGEPKAPPSPELDLVSLDEALGKLSRIDGQKTRIVELRYFAGLTLQETASVLRISTATVKRDWAMAKAWLHREIAGRSEGGS